MELFKSLNEEGQTIVMVTHNPENAAFSSRIIHLRDGRTVDGEPAVTGKTLSRQ
jgi:putative ABC transport system ATP-binding protein